MTIANLSAAALLACCLPAAAQVNGVGASVLRLESDVNDGPWMTLNVSGGSFNLPTSSTVPVALRAGTNTIRFGNPTSYPTDRDRIVIGGAATELHLDGSTFDAFAGTVTVRLHAGENTLEFNNPSQYAPNLDRIVSQG